MGGERIRIRSEMDLGCRTTGVCRDYACAKLRPRDGDG